MNQAGAVGKNKAKVRKIALFVLGAALVLFGILLGDCRRLFMKAIFVCMECAGIG